MTDAKARLLQMIADEPHMGGGGLLKAVGKAQKAAKKAETGARAILPAAERDANLAKMMADSKVKDRLYHGTTAHDDYADAPGQAFQQFTGQPTWLAKEPYTASGYAKGTGSVYPVHAQVKKPMTIGFDANDNASKAFPLAKRLGVDVDHMINMRKPQSAWEVVNDPAFVEAAMNAGHDAFLMNEGGYPTYGVFDPSKIKSAIGNRGTYDLNDPDITKATGGAVHMAGGGRTPKYPWERYQQPKKVAEMRARQINPIAGAVKKGADYATQLIDKGPSFSSLVGNLVGAVPFVGPDLRKRMEASDISIPTDITFGSNMPDEDYEYGQPMQYKKPGISTTSLPTKDVLEALNVSDLVGTPGLSKVAEDIGYGQMPDPLDLLDAASAAALGYGAVKAGAKGAKAAKQGALSAAKAAERFAEKKVPEVMERGGMGAEMLGAFGQNTASNVVKEPGGNWISGSVEQALKPLRRTRAEEDAYMDFVRQQREAGDDYGDWVADKVMKDPSFQKISGIKAANQYLAEKGMKPLQIEPREQAMNDWIDRNLTNYVKKQMATPGDPVRKLAEEGISHMPQNEIDFANQWVPEQVAVRRMNAGQPPHGIGQSNEAKGWESISDERVYVAPASEYTKPLTESEIRQGFTSVVDKNPWITKLDPSTPVHYLENPNSFASDFGFDHIVDVLKEDLAAGRIRPEQLNKISMEQAVRRTYEYDQEMAKKMRETQAKVTEGMPVYKEYPEGYKWIELSAGEKAKPKVVQLDDGSWTVEDITGHRMSGGFKSKQGAENALAQFSKSDKRYKEGIPETKAKALEQALKYEGDTMGHCVGGYCPDVEAGRSRIFSLRDAKGEPHVTIETTPGDLLVTFNKLSQDEQAAVRKVAGTWASDEALFDAMRQVVPEKANAPDRIVQIKGKQNRAPKEDYLPFVQDFVKGGTWEDVGDLRNTGLKPYKGNEGIKYVTPEEYEIELRKELGIAPPEPGMAEGGEVSNAKQRLLDMIAEEPHMAGGGVLKAIKTAQKTAKAAKEVESALKIKPPSDNILNVRQANFQYPKTVGNQTVSIDKLSGGVRMTSASEKQRVNDLASKISSPEGYISRLIVDQNNNVIEGQHRLEALRQLGIKDVPVYKIEELADTMPVSKMEAAVQSVGSIHSDHVGQLVSHALEHIAEGGIDSARKMNYGKFQKHYDAALDAAVGMQQTLPAVEREANLAKMLEGSAAKKQLYHGTGRDIKEFDKSKLRRTAFGEGFHLAESPNLANFYANQFDEGQNVMPVHAAIKKPYELKNMHDWYDVPGDSDKDKTNFLKSQGYDGVKYPHGAGGDETSPSPNVYVAFEPTQIKSATGNRGTYDTTDPDINKAEGGEIHMVFGGLTKAKKIAKAAEATKKAAEAAAKAAKVVPTPAAPAFIPGLTQKSTATEIGREERARRQAAAAAEAARVAAAKQTPVPVGYVKHTEKSPNPHVGYRFEATQHPGIAPPIPIDLAKLEREKKGASLGVMPWDSQSRNVEVSSISGEPLQTHLYTHAGQPYSLDEKHLAELIGGASAEEVADAIKTRDMFAAKENRERGGTGEVVHAVTTMGQYGENYSHPPSDFAFEIINRRLQEGKLTKKDLQALNNSIRTFQDKKKQVEQGIFPYANFAGFETPEGLQQIYTGGLGLNTSSGNLRKAIAAKLHKVGTQELLGFNSEDLINATTVPSLRGVDKGYIGGTLLSNDIGNAGFYGPRKNRFGMELAPAEGFPYGSPYSTDFSARYYGQLPDLVPLDVVMHRQLAPIEQGLLARENKKPYTAKSLRNAAIGSLEKSNEGVSQIMDARFFQDLADYFDALNKPLEKKKGGLAQTKKVKRHGNTVSN